MKLKEVFEKSVQFFKEKKFESARLDVELLLSHVLKIDRLQIYLKFDQPLSDSEIEKCRDVVRRRSQGEPVAYINGEKGFYGELYSVGAGVLIPRPETELIVEEALQFIKEKKITNPRVLDLGAGTGCIGFSILKNCDTATLTSVEKSEKAFSYLKENQKRLELESRSRIELADAVLFLDSDLQFDVIVANPPYIAAGDPLVEPNVKKYEPHEALFSAANGYQDIFQWGQKTAKRIAKPGLVLFEMGHQQGSEASTFFRNLAIFSEVKVLKDLSGLDRVLKAVNNSSS